VVRKNPSAPQAKGKEVPAGMKQARRKDRT